jgi:hypothetical protein
MHKAVKTSLEVNSSHLMEGKLSYIEKQTTELEHILNIIRPMLDKHRFEELWDLYSAGTRPLGSYKTPPVVNRAPSERPILNTTDIDGLEDEYY